MEIKNLEDRMEIKNLEGKIFKDLVRCGSFKKVLDTENEIVLLHSASAYPVQFTKDQNGMYNANFSIRVPEIRQLLKWYKKYKK
ncbi:MAG: hypothetical protein AABX44_00935 [Nanoarchaeota archaeon]